MTGTVDAVALVADGRVTYRRFYRPSIRADYYAYAWQVDGRTASPRARAQLTALFEQRRVGPAPFLGFVADQTVRVELT